MTDKEREEARLYELAMVTYSKSLELTHARLCTELARHAEAADYHTMMAKMTRKELESTEKLIDLQKEQRRCT